MLILSGTRRHINRCINNFRMSYVCMQRRSYCFLFLRPKLLRIACFCHTAYQKHHHTVPVRLDIRIDLRLNQSDCTWSFSRFTAAHIAALPRRTVSRSRLIQLRDFETLQRLGAHTPFHFNRSGIHDDLPAPNSRLQYAHAALVQGSASTDVIVPASKALVFMVNNTESNRRTLHIGYVRYYDAIFRV